jgi:hypothetical protein
MRAYNYRCAAPVADGIYNFSRLLHPVLDMRANTLQTWLCERVFTHDFYNSDVSVY